jgi:transcription elongation factor Elf1
MVKYFRARPMWIPSRVPAAIDCPSCNGIRSAEYTESPSELLYRYTCKNCGAMMQHSLEELNEPVNHTREGVSQRAS